MAIKRSKASFAAVVNGVPQVIPVGYLVEDGHPVLKGREHLFEDADTHVARRDKRVEQATAAPGEKRAVSRPTRPARPRGKAKDEKAGEGK
jgi:hypothetical protein